MTTLKTFSAQLTDAVAEAARSLHRTIANEHLYSFALYTSGEYDFVYVCASANTEEGLDEKLQQDAARGRAADSSGLRWSAPDWKYHDFFRQVREVALPEGSSARRDQEVYKAFVAALKRADDDGAFGHGAARENVAVLIVCGDMSEEFLSKGLKLLNPKIVVDRYLLTSTPEGLLAEIDQQPPDMRVQTLLEIYRDLALGRSTEAVRIARSRMLVNHSQLEPNIARLGALAVPRILDLIEEFGSAHPSIHRKTFRD